MPPCPREKFLVIHGSLEGTVDKLSGHLATSLALPPWRSHCSGTLDGAARPCRAVCRVLRCARVYVCARVAPCVCTCLCACACMCLWGCTCVGVHMSAHTCARLQVRTCVYACACLCMCVCTCVHRRVCVSVLAEKGCRWTAPEKGALSHPQLPQHPRPSRLHGEANTEVCL